MCSCESFDPFFVSFLLPFWACLHERYLRPSLHIYGKSQFHFATQDVKVMHGVGTISISMAKTLAIGLRRHPCVLNGLTSLSISLFLCSQELEYGTFNIILLDWVSC
jgi:hypothetical protein